ncbi:MAG: hypothetical protein AAB588_01510 [Patescibacteria group bacterium]
MAEPQNPGEEPRVPEKQNKIPKEEVARQTVQDIFALHDEITSELGDQPALAERYRHDPEALAGLIQLKRDAGLQAMLLFEHAFPHIEQEFADGGYDAVKVYWNNVSRLTEAAGSFAPTLLTECIGPLDEFVRDPKYIPDLIKILQIKPDFLSDIASQLNEVPIIRGWLRNDSARKDYVYYLELVSKSKAPVSWVTSFPWRLFLSTKDRPIIIKLLQANPGAIRSVIFERTDSFADTSKLDREFEDPSLQPGLFQILRAVPETEIHYFLVEGFALIKHEFKNPARRADVIKLIQKAGGEANILFKDVYPAIKDAFHAGGYRAVERAWDDAVSIVRPCKENSFLNVIVIIINTHHERFLSDEKFRHDLVKLATLQGKNTKDFLNSGLKSEEFIYYFMDDAIRPDLLTLIEVCTPNAALFLENNVFDRLKNVLEDQSLRSQILLLARDAGSHAPVLLHAFSPYLEELLRQRGYEGLKNYWKDAMKLSEAINPPGVKEMKSFSWTSFDPGEASVIEHFNSQKRRPDFIALAKIYGPNYGSLFDPKYFSSIEDEFRNDARRPDLLKLAQDAGPNAPILFLHIFPRLRERFKEGGYQAIAKVWKEYVKLMNATSRDYISLLLEKLPDEMCDDIEREGFDSMSEAWKTMALFVGVLGFTVNETVVKEIFGTYSVLKKFPQYHGDFVGIAREIQKKERGDASYFFKDLPYLPAEFADDELRPYIIKLAVVQKGMDFFKTTFGNIKDELRDPKLREDLMLLAESGDDQLLIFTPPKSSLKWSPPTIDESMAPLADLFRDEAFRPTFMAVAKFVNGYDLKTVFFDHAKDGNPIRSQFLDPKLRPGMIKLVQIFKGDINDFFTGGFYRIEEKFSDDRLRPDLLLFMEKMLFNASSNEFDRSWSRIYEEFNDDVLRKDIMHIVDKLGHHAVYIFNDFDRFRADFHNPRLLPGILNIVDTPMGDGGYELLMFGYEALRREGVDFSNKDETAKTLTAFIEEYRRLPAGIHMGNFFAGLEHFRNNLHGTSLEPLTNGLIKNLALFARFIQNGDPQLMRIILSHYRGGSRDFAPLKTTLDTLFIAGSDVLKRFVDILGLEEVLAPFSTATAEEKIIVAKQLIQYAENRKEEIIKALAFTKEEVDAYFAREQARPKQKLSNYFYIIQGYRLLGSDAEKDNVLRSIDLQKLIAEKGDVVEIFGVLQELEAPTEFWETAIRNFHLDLNNLKAVEKAREKLIEISPERANQIIEMKAREFVEERISAENLLEKVKFVKTWIDPKASGVQSVWDDRFVFDIYKSSATRMKQRLQQYCFENECKDIAAWGIFNEQELTLVQRVQLALQKQQILATPTPEAVIKQDPAGYLRRWALATSATPETYGMIFSHQELQNRLAVYEEMKKADAQEQLSLIRDQVIRYINKKPDELHERVEWSGEQKDLEDILADLDIHLEETGTGFFTKVKKAFSRPPSYTLRRVGEMIEGSLRREMSSSPEVKPGLQFSEEFTGGGEDYKGKQVELHNENMQPSVSVFTLAHGAETEAILVRFDPQKGAGFDFKVQIGATSTGGGKNLTETLRGKYGQRLILDTVGAMVQGIGIPISMIFENGEPQNKKTTMGGQRDGLVIFSPRGAMRIIKKTEIPHAEMAQLVDMSAFEKNLKGRIAEKEAELLKNVPAGSVPHPQELEEAQPDIMREYRRLLLAESSYEEWKDGKDLNYASQESYVPQDLFWMVAQFGKLSGFLESLYVEGSKSMVHAEGSAAHKRLLLQMSDGTYAIYDSRVPVADRDVSDAVSKLVIEGAGVQYAVNLDTGMADSTSLYDKEGNTYRLGHISEPVGTNRIGVFQKNPEK